MRFVKTQEDINELLDSLDSWHDAFIREAHLVSKSYVVANKEYGSGGTFAADTPPMLRILITLDYPKTPGIELLFENVGILNLNFRHDLEPRIEINKNVRMYFNPYGALVEASCLYFKRLDKTVWGNKLRYGFEDQFEDNGDRISPK